MKTFVNNVLDRSVLIEISLDQSWSRHLSMPSLAGVTKAYIAPFYQHPDILFYSMYPCSHSTELCAMCGWELTWKHSLFFSDIRYAISVTDAKVAQMLIKPKGSSRTSLVAQWVRICLPFQRSWVWCLVWEDCTCCGATQPVHHDYWSSSAPRLSKGDSWSPHTREPVLGNERSHHALQPESSPRSPQLEGPEQKQEDPEQPTRKNKILNLNTTRSFLTPWAYELVSPFPISKWFSIISLTSFYSPPLPSPLPHLFSHRKPLSPLSCLSSVAAISPPSGLLLSLLSPPLSFVSLLTIISPLLLFVFLLDSAANNYTF